MEWLVYSDKNSVGLISVASSGNEADALPHDARALSSLLLNAITRG